MAARISFLTLSERRHPAGEYLRPKRATKMRCEKTAKDRQPAVHRWADAMRSDYVFRLLAQGFRGWKSVSHSQSPRSGRNIVSPLEA